MMTENENTPRMPLIGDPAPSFDALTTQGTIHFPEDYKGKWVLFFSHPSDFTPVCTTEFMTLASMSDEFKAMNTELLGLSVDSLYSHIAWIRKIEELEWNGMKNVKIPFPVIADSPSRIFHWKAIQKSTFFSFICSRCKGIFFSAQKILSPCIF